ncbi:hypothetical protein [Turicibacter sp. TJ11]|uniref:hypothetical protein n=1 Tax=Turicibacter sp. TJ11 TaxID=2806443 RepID=UPI001F3CD770|nr:hypothetical protein [Turicibacter sp. TJ11]
MDNPTITYDCGLDQYGVGCALVTQLQMSVKSDVLIIPNDKIAIEIGLDIYNEVTQQWETIYTPLGVFYVDTIEEKGIKKSIKAYDGMFKLNKGYFPTTKHTTTQAIANDIATSNGYKIKGISNVTINNEQLDGKTCLEMLSLVASAIGGHVRISRDGSTIEFIEPTNYGETYDESDYTTPTIDDTTSYNITKLRVNYSDQVTNDEGTVTDEGYYEVGSGTDANTLAISNPLLKGQKSQAQIILDKVKRLNGYKRFDTSMPLADFRLDPMDFITYIKGEKECIVPILYMKMTLSYKGISIETHSPTVAETKTEFSFKGTLSQKVENIYTDIIQVKQLTANKVTTDELEATVAKIEQLYVSKVDADEIYANKAEIGDLVAGTIVVEELKAQIAEIDKAIINKADIEDLNATNATINSLKATVAEIDNLIADSILSEIIQSGSVSSDLLNVKDGFIKDAMISSLSASKIETGVINTNNVTIQSDNGNMLLQGNLLQFKDKNNKVRIQIGQDTSGNYTFTLYDATGQGVLINQDGVQSSNAIKDGLIVDSKVSDNANISGSKLNISSVYDEMNADGSKTLKASKVMLDEQNQTLDVSFKEMTTKQDELEESMSTAITDISVAQGQISQLIQNTTITTSEGTTTIKDAFNSIKSTVDSHTTQIGKVESTIDDVETRVSTAESKITDTAITNVVKQNFYTKTETENAITSKGYATQSQVQQTADNIQFKFTQSGGYNLVRNGNPKPHNYRNWWVSGNANWYSGRAADIGVQTTDTNEAYAGSATFKVQPGKAYSFNCWLMAESNTKGTDVYFIGSANDDGAYTEVHHLFTSGACGWTHVKKTFTTGSNINYGFIRIDNNGRKDTSTGNNTVVFFSEVLLVQGSEYYPQWSPNPNEVYDGIIEMDKDGIKVSTSNGGWTDFTSAGMNVYNKSSMLSLGTRNGGLTYHNSKGYLGFTSESNISSYNVSGVTLSTANNGSYIALGTSTATDPFGGFSSTPALSIAKADLGDSSSFYRQGVNLHTSLNVNTKPINRIGTMYYGVNGTTRTFESTTGNLCLFGDNGIRMGYYEGTTLVSKFELTEGSDKSTSYIDTYAHWRFHGWNLTDVANLSIKNNLKMETTATIQFNSTATYPSLIWEASNRLKLYGNDGIDFGYREGATNKPVFKITEAASSSYKFESYGHWNFNNWNLDNVNILKPRRLQLPSNYGSNWIELGTGDGNDYTTYNVKFRTHNGLVFTDNSDSATVIVQGRQGRIMGKNAYYVNCSRSLKSDIRSVISEDDVTTFVAKEGESLDTNISAETVCDFLDTIDVKTYVTDFKQEGATQECFDVEKGNSLTLGYVADDIADHPMFKYVGEKTNDGLYAINSNSLTTTLIVGYQQEKRKREQLEERLVRLEQLLKGDE